MGRYEILEEVGRGSMGVVYKARDPRIGRIVALKCVAFSFPLAPGEEEDFLRRFYHEAQIAGRLNHPGIVTIYDVGEKGAEGSAFIAMEFVTGTNLHELTASGGRLPLPQVADVARQAAEALDYAHENGVVHRDIKPGNLVLTAGGQLKIFDFGIARMAKGNITRPGQLLGTPNYMAPEQVTGGPVDGRADQFALAVTLYHLLTGERPFVGESITAISYQVVNVSPPPPSRLNPSLPSALDPILGRALAKSPEERYGHCAEFAAELGAAIQAWMETVNRSVPRTLVTGTGARAAAGMPLGVAVPRWLNARGPGAVLGWSLFLGCLALLAAAPYLYRGLTVDDTAPIGLIVPRFAGAPAAASVASVASVVTPPPTRTPDPIEVATLAHLVLSLQHRLSNGSVTVRIDGSEVARDALRSSGGKARWVRELPLLPGARRIEVRVAGDHGGVDTIEGIDLTMRPRERRELSLSISPLTHRLHIKPADGSETGAAR
jgi:predicted Ser/Thr protein kinase